VLAVESGVASMFVIVAAAAIATACASGNAGSPLPRRRSRDVAER
jgi:hypothetical protein